MTTTGSATDSLTRICRCQPGVQVWVVLLLVGSCVHPRPLTRAEQEVQVVPGEPETTKMLEKQCRSVATGPVYLREPFDINRRAGEYQAQVVQRAVVDYRVVKAKIVGVPECHRKVIQGRFWWNSFSRCEIDAIVDGQQTRMSCKGQDPVLTCAAEVRSQPVECKAILVTADYFASGDVQASLSIATCFLHTPEEPESEKPSHDLRFWQCPAERTTPKAGEVTWRMKPPESSFGVQAPPSYWGMQFFKGGQVVSQGRDAFSGLSEALSGNPVAAEQAKQAQSIVSNARLKHYLAGALGILFAGGAVVGTAGYFLHSRPLLYTGAGTMVVALPLTFIFVASGTNSAGDGLTQAMEAADRYNQGIVQESAAPVPK